MRIHICSPFGGECDLDNPETFKYLPDDAQKLRDIFFKEVGYSYWYMNFLHKDIWKKSGDGQKNRINKMIQSYTDNWSEHFNDILWLKEHIFLLQDEIENMC